MANEATLLLTAVGTVCAVWGVVRWSRRDLGMRLDEIETRVRELEIKVAGMSTKVDHVGRSVDEVLRWITGRASP